MRRASLAEAKAHLSELVDRAEHHKKITLILRHGKPAAALVPVGAVAAKKRQKMSEEEIARFFEDAAACGDPSFEAVRDLERSRR